MKIIAIKIDQETNELVLRAENPDGSNTAIVWDICNFIEGSASDLRMLVTEPDGKVDIDSIISIPMPGFSAELTAAPEVFEAQSESIEARHKGNLH